MIGKLRARFIRIVMEAFLVVLVLILVGVNLVNRQRVYESIDNRLTYLAESQMGPPVGMVASTPQIVRGWIDLNSAGIMNETSYFIFTEYTVGSIRDHQLAMLSLMTGENAEQFIEQLLAGAEVRGNLAQYRYFVATRETPYKIVFLNCENEFSSLRSLWRTSFLVGFVSFGLGLLLVALLSGKAIRPFAENIETQKRFISNASHELKTPLGVIMSDLDIQMLESGETEWLRNAQVQADHLALLIEQLTTYSMLSEKKRELPDVPVDMSALCEALISDFHPLARSRNQTITASIAPDVLVRGNEDALRTMLSVLLDNAVKYAPEGSEIACSVRREKKAVLRVENPCDNLDTTLLPQLFERFYRAPEHRSSQEGYGLGLSIAHDIAVMYGGSIRAESPDGRSVIFTIELP